MASIYDRLMITAQNSLKASAESFSLRDYLKASELAASSLGIFRFLENDPETLQAMRDHVARILKTVERRIIDSNIRLIRSKTEPRLSGRRDLESEVSAHVESLSDGLAQAAQDAIEEVGL